MAQPRQRRRLPLIDMPSEDTQFTRATVPARKGLPPNTKPIADKPISLRSHDEDLEPLGQLQDKSTFLRDLVHNALLRLNEVPPA
jgi:hypothetical protein